MKTIAVLAALVYAAVAGYFFYIQRGVLFPGARFDQATSAQQPARTPAPADPIPGAAAITLDTSDGERLAAWYRPARDNQPTTLFFHGNGGGLEFMGSRWMAMAARGVGVLAISYRGYPGSTGRPSEAGLARDAEAAYAWLRATIPAEQIIIHGFSLGTAVATSLAANVEARALILEAPFTSARAIAGEIVPFLPVRLLQRDPFLSDQRIARVNMPVLIAHGTRDDVIPFAHGQTLFAAAVEPKRFVAIANGTHGDLPDRDLYGHIWAFLDAHATRQPAGAAVR